MASWIELVGAREVEANKKLAQGIRQFEKAMIVCHRAIASHWLHCKKHLVKMTMSKG